MLLRIRYTFFPKSLSYSEGAVDKVRDLMLVSTGVAAVNIDGSTIQSALALSTKSDYSKCIPKLSD